MPPAHPSLTSRLLVAFVAAIFLPLLPARAADPSPLQVRTHSGLLEGKFEGPVRAFLGIPYAAPPVGERRWKPPEPPASWEGVRSAKDFGPRAMQPVLWDDMVFRDPGPSEDCLTLNVWTPAISSGERLPVMVWIHGGGYLAGASSEQRQDGSLLARKGVVVVSMNYRLGVFGFLALDSLAQESPHHAAGNYGLLDQLAALQWVSANIAAFGGDPDNLTISGQSAGSYSVCYLMASPLARGRFAKAIGESGGAFYSDLLPLKTLAQAITDHTARLDFALGRSCTLAELRAMPAEKLLKTVSPDGRDTYDFCPVIDGYLVPVNVPSLFASRRQNDVPLLAGWNRDESEKALPSRPPPMLALRSKAEKVFGAHASEFFRYFPANTPAEAARSGAELANDQFIVFATWAWLEAQANYGRAPVFRYRFDHAPPADFGGNPTRGAFHSSELPYVFGEFAAMPKVPWTDADRRVSEQIQAYWTNFARTGNPNGEGLPQWPIYCEANSWPVMHLDSSSVARSDELRPRYLFLSGEWAK